MNERARNRWLAATLLYKLALAGHLSCTVTEAVPVAESVLDGFPDSETIEVAERILGPLETYSEPGADTDATAPLGEEER